nr:hypothetical protein [Pseudomonas viridiflava]
MKLAGGLNNYQYVPNPTGWVDPLGLSSACPGPDCKLPTNSANATKLTNDSGKVRRNYRHGQSGSATESWRLSSRELCNRSPGAFCKRRWVVCRN